MHPYLKISYEDGLAIIKLDQPGEKVNTLDQAMIGAFEELLEDLKKRDDINAAVLMSGKDSNFIAGADINMFDTFETPEAFEAFVKSATDLLDRIEQFEKPIIAAINGGCIGGGLEVVLACHYRIASDDSSTKFAFPEVKLGLLPGAGGSQRLPKLVGIPKALDMMLTGKNIYPYPAKKMGLIDELTHKHGLLTAAKSAAEKLKKSGRPERKLKMVDKMLTHSPLRNIAFSQAKKSVMKMTRGNYPAPLKILESAKASLTKSYDKGFDTERRLFVELAFTPESQSLRNLFFGMQAVKKNPWKESAVDVKRIGILGSGLMGSGIADVSASNGYRVVLKDRDANQAAKGFASIKKETEKKVKKRIMSSFEADSFLAAITPTGSYEAFRDIPIVIEAVFEDLDIKHKVMKDVEAVSPDVIFASNTSSLPISDIAKGAKNPQNVIGMHYFSPVQKMPLLEIIKTEQTSDEALATAYEIGLRQGKTVIVVNDGPGFYTTRILAPFMNEALLLLTEGAKIESLDSAMKKFGFPVGPVVLMDEVGIDVAAHVAGVLGPMFEKRGATPSKAAKKLYDNGILGRKSGKGFYIYKEGSKKKEVNSEIYKLLDVKSSGSVLEKEIQERMSMIMLNEALLCLQEDILLSARDGDLGAILGLGFPPFLGGPFRYIDQTGPAEILKRMESLQEKHGARFKPAEILVDNVKEGKNFREK